jgi:RiboL-PSP-HEPN
MYNIDVQLLIEGCDNELIHIDTIITSLGGTNLIIPYLNKYSVIKSCGTIEISFKTLIADYCSRRSKPQVKRFLNKRVRESSANPSYEKIIGILKEFDNNWVTSFKTQMQAQANYNSILSSIQSLVDARNDFAHGDNPTITFADIKNYFTESKLLIETLDNVIGV